MLPHLRISFFFFFNDTATTEIYTLSLHDALPISRFDDVAGDHLFLRDVNDSPSERRIDGGLERTRDRKSTRLNSSHGYISYAVFCLKKKKNNVLPYSNITTHLKLHTKNTSRRKQD